MNFDLLVEEIVLSVADGLTEIHGVGLSANGGVEGLCTIDGELKSYWISDGRVGIVDIGDLSKDIEQFRSTVFAVEPIERTLLDLINVTYTDELESIESYQLDEDGTIKGVGVDVIGVNATKRISFEVDGDDIQLRVLNPDDIERFAVEIFAAKKGKSLKPKNCTKGLPCGGSCQSVKNVCTKGLSPEQKKLAQQAKKLMAQGKVGPAVDIPGKGSVGPAVKPKASSGGTQAPEVAKGESGGPMVKSKAGGNSSAISDTSNNKPIETKPKAGDVESQSSKTVKAKASNPEGIPKVPIPDEHPNSPHKDIDIGDGDPSNFSKRLARSGKGDFAVSWDDFLEEQDLRSWEGNQDNDRLAHNLTYEKFKNRTDQEQAEFSLASGSDKSKASYKKEILAALDLGFAPSDEIQASWQSDGIKFNQAQNKKIKENQSDAKQRKERLAEIKSRDAAVFSYLDDAGYAPNMSAAEARNYVKDSFWGDASFFHGGANDAGTAIYNNGVDLKQSNTSNSYYGQGFYTTPNPREAEKYAFDSNAVDNDTTRGSFIQAKINARNPAVMTAKEYDAIKSNFDGFDDENSTAFFVANGYDSLYVKDLGYLINFDSRQIVSTAVFQARDDNGGTYDRSTGQHDLAALAQAKQHVELKTLPIFRDANKLKATLP